MNIEQPRIKANLVLILVLSLLMGRQAICQTPGLYPPFTKWYEDPLALRPLQLSSAPGFGWVSLIVGATIIFTKKDPEFVKRAAYYFETGIGKGYKPPETKVVHNNFGLMYDLRKWMSVGMELNSFHFKDKINNTWGFGLRPFARWYPYQTKSIRIFFEYGGGLSYNLEKFPLTGTGLDADTARVGTKFNLTSKYGIGIVYKLNKLISIQTGMRHSHLSNGNLSGINRNPSHDSNGPFIGVIFSKQ